MRRDFFETNGLLPCIIYMGNIIKANKTDRQLDYFRCWLDANECKLASIITNRINKTYSFTANFKGVNPGVQLSAEESGISIWFIGENGYEDYNQMDCFVYFRWPTYTEENGIYSIAEQDRLDAFANCSLYSSLSELYADCIFEAVQEWCDTNLNPENQLMKYFAKDHPQNGLFEGDSIKIVPSDQLDRHLKLGFTPYLPLFV